MLFVVFYDFVAGVLGFYIWMVKVEKEYTREEALEEFELLRDKYREVLNDLHGLNEAETRLLIIDKVLLLLNWSEKEFNVELSTKSGFIDYAVGPRRNPLFVVEAKKIGNTFAGSTKSLKKYSYSLGYVKQSFGSGFVEVLKQASSYCLDKGVSFAILTNGNDWFGVQVLPQYGQKIDEQKCYYFGRLSSDGFHFNLFWDVFSSAAVKADGHVEHFVNLNEVEYEFTGFVSSRTSLPDLSGFVQEVKYHKEFYDYFFGEMIDYARRDMLNRCYVTTSTLDQYQGDLKRFLRDSSPGFIDDAEEVDRENTNFILNGQTGDKKGRVIIIAGSVGAGKSTFVRRVYLDARESKKNYCVLVDLIDEYDGEPQQVERYLLKEIKKEWLRMVPDAASYSVLKKIKGNELKHKRKGPKAKQYERDESIYEKDEADLLSAFLDDDLEYLQEAWLWYRKNKTYGISVILDNVDRAAEVYQRTAYSLAHKLAKTSGANIVVTMRESTVFRAQNSGFLDIRTDDLVYHLESPDPIALITKRINYIQNNLKVDGRYKIWSRNQDWEETEKAFELFAFELKEYLINGNDFHDIISTLSSMAWHDARVFLDILRKVHLVHSGEGNEWSFKSSIAALMLKWQDKSLPNMYEPINAKSNSCLIVLRMLIYMKEGVPTHMTRAGVSWEEIVVFGKRCGYYNRDVSSALQMMVQLRLLECLEIPIAIEYTKTYEVSEEHSFRLSPLAVQMLSVVQYETIYRVLCSFDVPYHNQSLLDEYANEVRLIVSTVEGASVQSKLDLIYDSKLDRLFVQHLYECLANETVFDDIVARYQDVATVERVLSATMQRYSDYSGFEHADSSQKIQRNVSIEVGEDQLLLFEADNDLTAFIGRQFEDVKIGNSTVLPLCFRALVYLLRDGVVNVKVRQLTEVINKFFVDDLNALQDSNVAKVLRSDLGLKGGWYERSKTGRSVNIRLAKGWELHWVRVFQSQPPQL